MDRIQKALDKAKENHANQGNSAPQQRQRNKHVAASDPLSAPLDENIAYTQTRVINISNAQLENKRIIANQYDNPDSAVFRMLRTQVLKKMRENDWQSLAVTSPTASEGKSLIASNLAVAVAMELNQTVLLVDLDLRNPSLSNNFSLNSELGLKDYLQGEIELHDVLINPDIERLVILPGVGRAEDSAELLSSPKMASLVADIKARYDSRVIIFDVPPLLVTDDVVLASDYFDCTLMVIEDGHNSEADITKSLQLVGNSHLLGTVLNKSLKTPTHQSY
jgi:protein-tyrosine kinase